MKILASVDRTWPCDHAFIEEVLAKRLPAKGHTVRIVMVTHDRSAAGTHRWHGATVDAVYAGSQMSEFFAKWNALQRLRRAEAWDWLFVRNDSLIAFGATLSRIPVVFQLSHQKEETRLEMVRGKLSPKAQLQWLFSVVSRFFRRRAMARAKLALPISDHLKDIMRATGERTGESVVMPLGAVPSEPASPEARRKTRARLGVPDDMTMFLYLGTLNQLRRLDTLVEATALVRKQGRNAGLWMFGGELSPNDTAVLKKSAAANGITDAVFLPGKVSRQDTVALNEAADFGLSYFPDLPLFQQNSPTKVMEYLGQGLPAICSPQPEQIYAVDACMGGVVADGFSAQSIADAMIKALDMSWDRARIRREFLAVRSYDVLATRLEQALAR